jgi:hypothetical protein
MSSKQNQAVFTTNIQRFFWLFKENERKEHQFNITEITLVLKTWLRYTKSKSLLILHLEK